jgi:ADP-ribose pyrophosphatase YjhB (NUDIX family)
MSDGWLTTDQWNVVKRSVPIATVEFVPIRRDTSGAIDRVGLIYRHSPFGGKDLWCQPGGRVQRGETLHDALNRHATSDLLGDIKFSSDARPLAAMEWFPPDLSPDASTDRPTGRYGIDPRQHSVGFCFAVEPRGDLKPVVGGEALQFRWFEIRELDELDTWPGTRELVNRVIAAAGSSR